MNREELLRLLACPNCHASLNPKGASLFCACGAEYPVVREIPRFVPSDAYVGSFSFEWNTHKTTQLDNHRGDRISEEALIEKTGLTPEQVRGKVVLDAGVGSGRYSDVLARWGASVVGMDLSYAVEAAHSNLKSQDSALVVQADIGRPPFKPGTFDYIISIGVLHHTPDTRAYFNCLVPLLRPGGEICIWVYPNEGGIALRTPWIPFTSRIPTRMFYDWCAWFVPLAHRNPKSNLIRWISQVFPFSSQPFGLENDILDTFDGFSPRYHGVHSPEEVEGWFREAGLTNVSQPGPAKTSVRGALPRNAAQACG